MNDLKIISFTKKELRKNLDEGFFNHNDLIGLSKNKIQWLLENTRIDEDDYCIVQAQDGTTLVSDIFMVPDLVKTKNKELKKVYWIINWWVHPEYENTIIGSYLYSEASRLVGHKIVIESYVENTADFYNKQPYIQIADRLRHILFLRLDVHLIVSRLKFLKPFQFLLKPLCAFISYLILLLNRIKTKNNTNGLTYEYVSHITDATWLFMSPFLEKDLAYKTKEYINWQLNANQYVKTPIASKARNKALIKGTAKEIFPHTYAVFDAQEQIGFVSFLKIESTVYLKYCIANTENSSRVIDSLIEHLIHYKITSIYTDNTIVAERIQKQCITIYKHSVSKKALAHKTLSEDLEGLVLSEADGNFH